MKFKVSSMLLGTLLLFSASQQAGAWMRDITNGIICKPMLDSQTGFVDNKSWGLSNNTTTTDVWVGCPFHRLEETSIPDQVTDTEAYVKISMSNRNGFSVSGSCLFREVDLNGNIVTTWSEPFMLPAIAHGFVLRTFDLSATNTTLTFACLLPRNSHISRIIHSTRLDP